MAAGVVGGLLLLVAICGEREGDLWAVVDATATSAAAVSFLRASSAATSAASVAGILAEACSVVVVLVVVVEVAVGTIMRRVLFAKGGSRSRFCSEILPPIGRMLQLFREAKKRDRVLSRDRNAGHRFAVCVGWRSARNAMSSVSRVGILAVANFLGCYLPPRHVFFVERNFLLSNVPTWQCCPFSNKFSQATKRSELLGNVRMFAF